MMSSYFGNIPLQPPNSVLGLALECSLDKFENKIDLIIGAYRDDNGNSVVLNVVKEAEEFITKSNFGHEYLNQGIINNFIIYVNI